MLGELTEVLPQFGRWVGLAQVVQAHFIVSTKRIEVGAVLLGGVEQTEECPVSCAPM